MKRFVLILFGFFFICWPLWSQNYEIKREVKQLVRTRNIYINGGLRAEFGGKSRVFIPVDLPPNTVKWYYSFSTSRDENNAQNINLGLQLTAIILDPTFSTANVVSKIKVPDGVASADIFLMDKKNMEAFMDKADNNGGTFYFSEEGSVMNTKNAVVEIDDIKNGRMYLGLRNPSTTYGLNLSIEVVAITETKILIKKSENQEKAEMYGMLAKAQYDFGEYEKCVEYCDSSLEIFEMGWVWGKKGLAQLMLDKESEAMDSYVNAITIIKKNKDAPVIFGGMLRELDSVLVKKPELTAAEVIKQLIEKQN
ncbi:MAG TPA: hypothetical protein PLP62_03900 [Flavobacteriaceae bacterium]|nr:hypothetical protein [Flavobacteriaceae bacterium]MCB9212505.1 hypothetical protein [Alteromonas sp.]HPF10568.1 hypothetical protein [Flavobacteriaceae bacterium]HQU64334.1 hypothetical protein [Flavobacteriaceae bacterium]HRW43317.1 hypothetical protein [Flavobacteriaceae bacterium]